MAIAMLAVLVGALLVVAAIHGLQVWATFPSPPAAAGRPSAVNDADGETLWLEVGGDRVEAWLLPAPVSGAAPLLMFTHGNGELIDYWANEFTLVRAAGMHVLLVEYPGYGRSRGRASEATITATLLAAYDRVLLDPRVDAGRIVGYGRSLGGGAIAQLAAHRPMAALVLESTFTSLADIVRGFGIPNWLIANSFDTRAALAGFNRPVLLLHGTRDSQIPASHAEALRQALPGSTLKLLDCGHNDCPRQWELVLGFLARNGVCSKPDKESRHENSRDSVGC